MVRTRCRHNQRNFPGCCYTTPQRSLRRTSWTIYSSLEQLEAVSGLGLALSSVLGLAASVPVPVLAPGLVWVALDPSPWHQNKR